MILFGDFNEHPDEVASSSLSWAMGDTNIYLKVGLKHDMINSDS